MNRIALLLFLAPCAFSQSPNDSGSASSSQTNQRIRSGAVATAEEAADDQSPSKQIEATLYASHFSGADAGAKIAACVAALPARGGTCDARGLSGAQSISAEISVPANAVLILGHATFTATAVPVFTLHANSQLIGQGALAIPTEGTTIVLSGITGVAVKAAGLNASTGIVVKNIHVKGTWAVNSSDDGSIGFDFQGMANGWIAYNRAEHFYRGFRSGFPTWKWNCDCYNLYVDNQVVGARIGVDFQPSTNKATWSGGGVQPFGKGGAGFRLEGLNIVLISPDVENFAGGTAFDILTSAHQILSPYIEAGGTAITFEGKARSNQVTGGTSSSLSAGAVMYADGADIVTNVVKNMQNGPAYANVEGAFTFRLGQGSEPNFYELVPRSGFGAQFQFVKGSQAEKAYGRTGPAPLAFGSLSAKGGSTLQGTLHVISLANPAAPTITQVGAPGSATYSYKLICFDYSGAASAASAAASIATGNEVLDATNYNSITYTCGEGYKTMRGLKLFGAEYVSVYGDGNNRAPNGEFKDTGQSGTEYVVPTRNTTGDTTLDGTLTVRTGGSANKAICWKADGKTLGYCSTAPDETGSCSCK